MKLREIIERLDKSPKNSNTCDVENLRSELGLQSDWETPEGFDDRLISYWIDKHYCTDQWVGTLAYFFDGVLVAVSNQRARKSSEIFSWVSNVSLITRLRDYLVPILPPLEEEHDLDLEEEWGDGYTVNFYCQLLTEEGSYKGTAVTVIGHHKSGYIDGVWENDRLIVRFSDRTEKTIPISEFLINFGIIGV